MDNRNTPQARRAGFTLIELLAVIIILSILSYFLVVNLVGVTGAVDIKVTQITGTKIGGAIQEQVDDTGDYPRSSFASDMGTPPNNSNLGSECLYLALCAETAPGFGLFDDHLSNTDGDQLAKRPPGFEVPTLFELCDQWGNPFAYFHHRDYGRVDAYVTISPDTGERIDSSAQAVRNPETGRYYEPRSFQLISAGPDGSFETTDDNVTVNFSVPRAKK